MNAILLLLFLAPADVSLEANKARLEQSIREGTGGDDARWILCNLAAVEVFYDGKQTPRLIPADLLWSDLGYQLTVALPTELSEAGRALVTQALRQLRARHQRFKEEGLAIASAIADTPPGEEEERLRRTSRELSNRSCRDTDAAARSSLEKLFGELSDSDRAVFTAWLEEQRSNVVILRFDWTRVDFECLERQR